MQRASESARQWMNAAGRFPIPTAAQEVHWGRAIRAWLDDPAPAAAVIRRGQRARDSMVRCNLRMVPAVERKLPKIGELEDRLQHGAIGLTKAAEKFDPERGYRFSTYAYFWIRQAINRAGDQAPTRCGIRVPPGWSWDDPRRRELDRVPVQLDSEIPCSDGARPVAEVVAGETLDVDDLALVDGCRDALRALEHYGNVDDLALVMLHVEGHLMTELGQLYGVKSASTRVMAARRRLRAVVPTGLHLEVIP